jgi:hypothetical protein
VSADVVCPDCGCRFSPVADIESRITAKAEELRADLESRGVSVGFDREPRVTEAVAADLLGRAVGTLRNWRYGASPLQHIQIGGRYYYRLKDIASLLVPE